MKQQLRRVLPILLTVAMVITTWATPLTSATVYAASQDEKSDVQNPGEDQENQNPEVKKAKTAGEDSVPESSVKEEPDSEAGKSGKNVELNELSDSSTHTHDNSDNISVDGKCADTEKDSETSNVISNNVSEKQKNSIKKENTSVAKTEVQKDTASVNPQEEPVSEDETQAEIRLTVKLSGTAYTVGEGASLESVIEGNDIALGEITSIEFVSGTVTEEDLKYISSQQYKLTTLAELKVNLGDGLTYTDASGTPSTTLPDKLFSSTSSTAMRALTTVELKGFTALGATSLNLKKMTSLSIPDVTTIGSKALANTTALTSIDMSSVTSIGENAFEKSGIKEVILNGVALGESAFYSSKLETVTITGINEIPEAAFQKCTALTTVNMSGVKTVGMEAFAGCTKAEISPETIASLTTIGIRAFDGCKAITGKLTLSEIQSVGSGAFTDCTGITEADLTGQTEISTYMFDGCKGLKTVTMPDVTTLGDYAFQDCTSLTAIDLKNITSIPKYAFSGCSNLAEADLSNIITVGDYGFEDCKKLSAISLPEATTIGKSAFDGCTAVTEISIPKVTSIGASAFAGIKNVVQVTIDSATPPTVSGNPFSNVKDGSTLKVPKGSLENYLTNMELGEIYSSKSNVQWNSLAVVDDSYVNITYKSSDDNSSYTRYQILEQGQPIGEKIFSLTRNGYQLKGIYKEQTLENEVAKDYVPQGDETLYEGWSTIKVFVADENGEITDTIEMPTNTYNELRDIYPELPEGAYQWNTEKDGSGRTILSDTKIYSDITIYPIFKDIINTAVKINDEQEVGSATLRMAVEKAAGENPVKKLEVVSGRMTADDYAWLASYCQNSTEKVETLIVAEGVVSENETFPASQSFKGLKYLELHGIKTLEYNAVPASTLETIILPDVEVVGNNAFGSFSSGSALTKVEMPKVKELGNMVFAYAFQGDAETSLDFPNLTKIGNNTFKGCTAPLRITVNQIPDVGTDTFTNSKVTLVVPAEVYDAYYAEHQSDEYEGATLERGESLVTDVVTVKIDGTEYGAESLEAAVKESGIDADDVESLEFVSGTITADDLAYMKESTTYLKVLKMNLSETLKLTDKEGKESTVLPGSAFKGTRLENVELGGFTEIGGSAFRSCRNLTAVSMPNVETIGKEAFYWTDEYEEIILPASIKTLNDCGFGVAENGKKTIHVTIQSTTPPEVKGSPFKSAGSDSYIEVPEESLPNYLDNWDFSKVAYSSGDMLWGNLRVEDPAYHLITYKAFYQREENGAEYTNTQYAYVKNGEKVTEARISKGPSSNLGKELVGWNTKEDGTGTELTAETVPTESMTVYAQWEEPKADVVTAAINGTNYGGESLADAVANSGIAANKVASLEFISGEITNDDLKYIKSEMKNSLVTLKMNLSDTLKFKDANGNNSTILPSGALQRTGLVEVELGGFTEIQSLAFQTCTKLEKVSMPDMVKIGSKAFYQTDEYEEIVLPASIKELDDCGFYGAANGKKDIHVTMEGKEPPTLSGKVFTDASSDSYVTIPEGTLTVYLPDLDLTKVHYNSGDMLWGNLRVEDPAYHLITYKASYQTEEGGRKYSNIQYAYVKNGEAVTEARISKGPSSNLGKELVGWNTKEDGTGTELTAETVPTESMTVYAQWAEPLPDVVTVKLNGTEVKGSSLEDAVRESKIAVKDLESIQFVSGKVTQEDLDYVSELTYVETFVMNLGENLTLYGKDGKETTVLDGENAALIFAAAPNGWSKPAVRSVTLGGITEIDKGGLKGSSIEELNMPDVVTVGTSAFAGFSWLESINLDKAEVIGESAFFNCTRLTDVTMNSVKTMKKGAFKYTNSLKKMTIPETIESIEDIEFGSTTQGNKNGSKITIKAMTPPTVDRNAFEGVASSGTSQSTVTVPHGALAAYVAQINSKADVTKVLQVKDTIWNNLYLLEEGSYRIEYKIPQKSWMTQYAFVAEGGQITQDQIATVSAKEAGKEGCIFTGWNTKQDGSGDMLEAGMTIESNMTVYPVWKEAVTLTFNVDGEVTTMEVVKGEAIGSNLPADPAKEGYEFQGWNTQPDGSGEAVTEETLAQEDMTVYAVFKEVEEPAPDPGEEILPEIDSIKVDNGKVIINLKDKPANAPEAEDIRLQMNLNGTGNKDLTIKSFEYDGNKTIVLTFDKVAQTDKDQKFTVTVTLGGKSVTSDAVTVKAKDSSKTDENKKDDTKTKDNDTKTKDKDTKTQKAAQTGDETPVAEYFGLAVISLLAAVIVWRRKKSQ